MQSGSGYHKNLRTTEPSEIMKDAVGNNKTPAYHHRQYVHRQPVPPFSPNEGHFTRTHLKPIPGKHLQSVVTTSFSVDGASLSPDRHHISAENREASSTPPSWQKDTAEGRLPPPPAIVVTTTAPRGYSESEQSRPHPISRSYSATTIDSYNSLPMKRNFFHHVQSSQSYGGLPPDFVPPKRSKAGSSSRKTEIILAARPEHNSDAHQWYSHPPHWESQYRGIQGYHDDSHMRSQSFPSPRWTDQKQPAGPIGLHRQHKYMHESYSNSYGHGMQVIPGSQEGRVQESWRRPDWYAHPQAQGSQYWDAHGQGGHQNRDDVESMHPIVMQGEMRESFDEDGSRDSNNGTRYSNRNAIFRHNTSPQIASHSNDKMKLVVEAASFTEGREDFARKSQVVNFRGNNSPAHGTLLTMPEDKVSLSETLCVVRENIEVFQATQSDVDAPAPGRKHAIVVGQVGLRCIHCRHTTKASDRVKRAVCYPSSLKRIYRTVIDMKLDHFSQCKYVPASLKQRLDDLKSVQTRSTGTTMQYFIKSAKELGMEDASSGVRLNRPIPTSSLHTTTPSWRPQESKPSLSFASISEDKPMLESSSQTKYQRGDSSVTSMMDISKQRSDSMASSSSFEMAGLTEGMVTSGQFYDGMIPLALPEDASALSPLRCFLREQVCAFSATENDIAARAPTTFTIGVGQVGVGCIHCVKQPARLRSNRAVCFPFSVGRIYQSVADIQRFHLTECKNLPEDVRQKFISLQNASSKGSKGLATRQYWVVSAKKLGLVDTPKGIRFSRDPSKPLSPRSFSLDILAQAAFSVTTTNKKLVLPEDKDMIAEFLYVVMEQLQPCRFTEADRNKRRLKDVGCIGVECKHCAGQVDSRKFFWSSVSAVESNFVSVHSHMFECRMVPQSLKDRLTELKSLRKEQTAKLMTGSQKAFFQRVWERLHHEEETREPKRDGEDSFSTSDDESTHKMEEV